MCPRRVKKDELTFLQMIGSSFTDFQWEAGNFEAGVRERVSTVVTRLRSLTTNSTFIDGCKQYARANPLSTLVIVGFLICIGIPITFFIGFAITAVLIGIGSFVIIEGTLITIALFILGSCLVVTLVVAGSFTVCTLLLFYILNKAKTTASDAVKRVLTGRVDNIGGQGVKVEPASNGNSNSNGAAAELVQSD